MIFMYRWYLRITLMTMVIYECMNILKGLLTSELLGESPRSRLSYIYTTHHI